MSKSNSEQNEDGTWDHSVDWDTTKYIGDPDGPLEFIPTLGIAVPTFLSERKDLRTPNATGIPTLMYHVPAKLRQYYTKSQLPAEFVEASDPNLIRVTDRGMVMCTAIRKGKAWNGALLPNGEDDPRCNRMATHRTMLCQHHGGRLHPLDRTINTDSVAHAPFAGDDVRAHPEKYTRWQRLLAGELDVNQLDDEELARGRCRDKNGTFAGPEPAQVPKAMHDRMVKELFQRADNKLKESLLEAVEAMTDIAKGDAYEAADRIKAATWIFERLRGKTPDVVVHTQDKPWEHIMTAISGGSREESRKRRGLESEATQVVEAEVVDDPSTDMETVAEGFGDPEDTWSNKPGEEGAYKPNVAIHRPEGEYIVDPMGSGRVDLADDGVLAEDQPQTHKIMEAVTEAEAKASAKKALKDRLKKAKGRRYSARSRGAETITVTPYVAKTVRKRTPEGKIYYQTTFKEPTAPQGFGRRRSEQDMRHRI